MKSPLKNKNNKPFQPLGKIVKKDGEKREEKNPLSSCYIIGQDSLCLQCSKRLYQAGWIIQGVVTQDSHLVEWAKEKEIPVYFNIPEWFSYCSNSNHSKFDYLFSIVNPHILKTPVLKLPRQFTINYHDSLLPRYAGVHATSWAILNGEKEHGVTWHVVDQGIDTGAILKQAKIEIDERETTLSLNMKCYEAAVTCFETLIQELESNSVSQQPQEGSVRSYYGSHQKPKNNGLITWQESAEELDRFCRACTFGEYSNRFSVLKWKGRKNYFIIGSLINSSLSSKKKPGTIVKITKKSIFISTTTNDVVVSECYFSDGQPCSINHFVQENHLLEGDCVALSPTAGLRFSILSFALARHEVYWKERLMQFSETSFPYQLSVNKKRNESYSCFSYQFPPELIKIVKGSFLKNIKKEEIVFSLFMIYFSSLSQGENLSVGVFDCSTILSKMAGFLPEAFPFNIALSHSNSLENSVKEIFEEFFNWFGYSAFLKDIFSRYPKLKTHQQRSKMLCPAIKFIFVKSFIEEEKSNTMFQVQISKDVWEYKLSLRTHYGNVSEGEELLNRITCHINNLLTFIINHPKRSISELCYLTSEEINHINNINVAAEYSLIDKGLMQIFEENVREVPNKVALVSEREEWTYHQVNEKANQLANLLCDLGVHHQDRVALFMERSVGFVVSVVSILKLGAIYIPIDVSYPSERVESILNDSKIQICLVNRLIPESIQQIAKGKSYLKVVDISNEKIDSVTFPLFQPHSFPLSDVAYIMYTSGSTGKPKGIEVTHKGIIRLVVRPNYIHPQPTDCFACLSNIAFDASTFEIWGAFLNKAKLRLISKEEVLDINRFADILYSECSVVFVTTALFNQLVSLAPYALDRLRYLLFGGEASSPTLVKKLSLRKKNKKLKHLNFLHMYGPTENTTFSTYCDVTQEIVRSASSIPIGIPLSGTQTYILDRYGKLLPQGVTGELYLGGMALAKGYLNKPKLTREKFVENPFLSKADRRSKKGKGEETRLYRTGDLVRLLSSGLLDFVGRIDNQVKVRGFRVELDEIAVVLSQHSDVDHAVVIFLSLQEGKKNLVAYFVPSKEGRSINHGCLKKWISQKLPHYMVPQRFIQLDQWPLNPNGKIDKKALPFPQNGVGSRVPLSSPENEFQRKLVKIWEEVLRISPIGIHDNFFELGGESIVSLQIIAKARRQGLSLKAYQLFNYPTIFALSGVISQEDEQSGKKDKDLSGKVALIPIQKWFFEQAYRVPENFNQYVILKCRERLDVNLLGKAFSHLVKHHDMLRSGFKKTKVGWQQIIFKQIKSFSVSRHNVEEMNAQQFFSYITNYVKSYDACFEFKHPPLLQVIYFNLKNTIDQRSRKGDSVSPYLFIRIHHLIVDGVSWRILLEDLELVYKQLIEKQSMKLPMKTTSFQDWGRILDQYSQTKPLRSKIEFWNKVESCQFNLPVDLEGGECLEKNSDNLYSSLSGKETKVLLYNLYKRSLLSIPEVLLAGLMLSFYENFELSTLFLYLEGNGRDPIYKDVDLSRTVGWFTSLYPAYFDISNIDQPLENFGDVLYAVRKQFQPLSKGGIDYGVIRYLVRNKQGKGNGNKGRNDDVTISFNYLGNFDKGSNKNSCFSYSKEAICWEADENNHRAYLIDITAWVEKGKLNIKWRYSKNHYYEKTIRQLDQGYLKYLRQILTYILITQDQLYLASDFPMVNCADDQIKRLINQFNDMEDMIPLTSLQEGLLFHSLYEEHPGTYLTQIYWEQKGGMDLDAFQSAWEKVIDHFDILRTVFAWEEVNSPVQIRLKTADLPWRFLKWTDRSEKEKKEALKRYIEKDRKESFDFQKPPLMRVTVIQLRQDQYVIVWTHHHILLDGWSVSLILNYLYDLYEGRAKTKNVIIPNEPGYKNYLIWLKQQDRDLAKQFWVSYLKEISSPICPKDTSMRFSSKNHDRSFSIDYFSEGSARIEGVKKVKERRNHSTVKENTLSSFFTKRLISFGSVKGITLNTLIQTAWSILLSRYAQTDDVVFDVAFSMRPAAIYEVESMAGLLINTLPFRVTFNDDQSLSEILFTVQQNMLNIIHYGYVSLLEIKDWNLHRRPSNWFNTLFIFENYPFNVNEISENIINLTLRDKTHYPLTLTIFPGERIRFRLVYDSDVFHPFLIRDVLMHLQEVLKNIISYADSSILEPRLFSQSEESKLFFERNKTKALFPKKTIVELFEEEVTKHPNTVAVVDDKESLTYRELNKKANQLAHYLIKKGVKKETLVAICVTRNINMIIGMLGIVKAGGAYVPLDPAYPCERIQYIVEDSQAKYIVAENGLSHLIEKSAKNIKTKPLLIYLDKLKYENKNLACYIKNPKQTIAPNNIIYVMYTSGSTGKPKGVLVEHRHVVNLVYSIFRSLKVFSEDCLLAVTTFSFDISVLELLGSLIFGMRLVIADQDMVVDGEILKKEISRHRVTIMQATPVTWRLLLMNEWKAPSHFKALCGGEQLPQKLATEILDVGATLWNVYGPTETTIWSTLFKVEKKNNTLPIVSIGEPIKNTQVYILDQHKRLVPDGVYGELYIGGEGVSRGYLNRPNLTKSKFLSHLSCSKSILYRTGDLVRWLPDKRLEYAGRIDNQIKIRGYRVELGEIESCLNKNRAVDQSAVVLKSENDLEGELVAYIVLKQDVHSTSSVISSFKSFLKERLPSYMIPIVFIILNEFPLTPNGKIDRTALPVPEKNLILSGEKKVKPKTNIEKQVERIWSEVLGRKQIGIRADFFELGGHSLLSFRLISDIKKSIDVDLSIRDLLHNPTIFKLSETIQGKLLNKERNRAKDAKKATRIPSPIIQLSSCPKKPILFLIHPVGGTIFWYIALAKYLNQSCSVYALQDPGIESGELWFNNIEEMGTFYLKEIKKVQRQGPYFLGGASFGSTVAFEIVKQLEQTGEAISFLGILDGWGVYPSKIEEKAFLEQEMWRQYHEIKSQLQNESFFPIQPIIDLHVQRNILLRRYSLGKIQSKGCLFKAKEIIDVLKPIEAYDNHWGDHISNLEIIRIPGNHETMFYEPNVKKLSNIIKSFL